MKKLSSWFSALCWGLALFAVPSHEAIAGEPSKDSILVIVSVDGLAGFYFDDPKANLIHLRKLAARGAWAERMRVSLPSVTWTNHTTMITGVPPAVHGVIGNRFFNRSLREIQQLNGDPVFDKDEIVKVPTLYDIAHENGFTTAGVRWPATRNAKTLDWTVPSVKNAAKAKPFTTPSLLDEASAATGFDFNQGRNDTWRITLFNYILTAHRPQLAILHLSETDGNQHRYGPRSKRAYKAIEAADQKIGELWELLQREFPERATLFVVSDHGFAPVDFEIQPYIALRKAGLLPENLEDSEIQLAINGGAAMLYLLDEKTRASLLETVKNELQAIEGIDRILEASEFPDHGVAPPEQNPHAPDLLLLAKEGYAFGINTEGDEVVSKTETRIGAHGHDPNLANLHGFFIACGAGIKAGSKLDLITNTRIAPTAAQIMGLSLPEPADAPLHEFLEKN